MRRQIFICDPEIVLHKPISGQDFYLATIVEYLKNLGYEIMLIHPRDLSKIPLESLGGNTKDIDVHLHYVNLSSLREVKRLLPNARLHLYVYQLSDPTLQVKDVFKYWIYLLLSVRFITDFVTTSTYIASRLMIIHNHVHLVEPFYPCDIKNFNSLLRRKLESLEMKKLVLINVGRINKWRTDIPLLLKLMRLLSKKEFNVRLSLISLREMGMPYVYRAIRYHETGIIEFIGRRLSIEEKINIYNEAHFLVLPMRGYSAMRPPLSVIEAVCHGVIPISSHLLAQDLPLPKELLSLKLNETELLEIIEFAIQNYKDLVRTLLYDFKKFYSPTRFVRQLKSLLDEGYG
jgi:glycosyltransferase involved in cell wall biosynthesis